MAQVAHPIIFASGVLGPRRTLGPRLNYVATAAHAAAVRRCPGVWDQPYEAVLPDGATWHGFRALDEEDARSTYEYYLSRYHYPHAEAFFAAWVAGGRQVRCVPVKSYGPVGEELVRE